MYDQSESELLRMLADRAGIVADYYDIAGIQHVTTDETRRAILSAMELRVGNREELIEKLVAWDNRPWLRGCEPVHVIRLGREVGTWSLHVPCEVPDDALLQVRWSLRLESEAQPREGTEGPGLRIEETRTIHGRRFVRVALNNPPDLPIGYHAVQVWAKTSNAEVDTTCRFIVAPERCYIPDQLRHGARW